MEISSSESESLDDENNKKLVKNMSNDGVSGLYNYNNYCYINSVI